MNTAALRFRWMVAAALMMPLALGGGLSIALHAQTVAAPTAVIRIEGAVPTPLSLTSDDLAKMPRTTAPFTGEGGVTLTYEGVLLYDILVKAGWQFGHGMTGKPMASYLLATGKDGYQVVYALAEVDPQFAGAKVILADKVNGGPLPAKEQPFRLVAPEDKMHARSLYSLQKLEVVRLRP